MQNMSPINLIKAHLPNMSVGEKKISSYILDNYSKITQYNIGKLSEKIDVSESSIIRYTKMLGYTGFRDFKLACATFASEDSPYYYDDIDINDLSFESVLKTYLLGNIEAIQNNLSQLDFQSLEKIAKLIGEKENIYIAGEFLSGNLAHGLYLRMRLLFKNVFYIDSYASDVQNGFWLEKDDIVIAITQTGNSIVATEFAEKAKKEKATVVAITTNLNSKLIQLADYSITPVSPFNNSESRYINTEAMIKMILDALYIYLQILRSESEEPSVYVMDKKWFK